MIKKNYNDDLFNEKNIKKSLNEVFKQDNYPQIKEMIIDLKKK